MYVVKRLDWSLKIRVVFTLYSTFVTLCVMMLQLTCGTLVCVTIQTLDQPPEDKKENEHYLHGHKKNKKKQNARFVKWRHFGNTQCSD